MRVSRKTAVQDKPQELYITFIGTIKVAQSADEQSLCLVFIHAVTSCTGTSKHFFRLSHPCRQQTSGYFLTLHVHPQVYTYVILM